MKKRANHGGASSAGNSEIPKSFRNLMTFRLHMVARLSERVSEEFYGKRFDLTLPECRVIGITAGYGSVSFKKVASETYLEKSYASRVVSSLVGRGMIEKLENPEDSRSVLLRLTDYGVEVHREMHDAATRLNERLQSPFSPDQVQTFLAVLRILEGQLEGVSRSINDDEANPGLAGEAITQPYSDETGEAVLIDRRLAESLAQALSVQLSR